MKHFTTICIAYPRESKCKCNEPKFSFARQDWYFFSGLTTQKGVWFFFEEIQLQICSAAFWNVIRRRQTAPVWKLNIFCGYASYLALSDFIFNTTSYFFFALWCYCIGVHSCTAPSVVRFWLLSLRNKEVLGPSWTFVCGCVLSVEKLSRE